jgi:hypothetical protein
MAEVPVLTRLDGSERESVPWERGGRRPLTTERLECIFGYLSRYIYSVEVGNRVSQNLSNFLPQVWGQVLLSAGTEPDYCRASVPLGSCRDRVCMAGRCKVDPISENWPPWSKLTGGLVMMVSRRMVCVLFSPPFIRSFNSFRTDGPYSPSGLTGPIVCTVWRCPHQIIVQ